MKCAINTLPFDRGGGITYLKNVLPRLEDTDDQYYIIVPSGRNELESHSNMEYIEVNFPTENLFFRLIYEQFILPFVLFRYNIDVFYSPTGITTLLSPCPTVNAVRDPNPFISQPDRPLKDRLKARAKRFLIRLSIWRAEKTIFVSQYTKEIVSEYIPVDDETSHIVYHGINKSQFEDTSLSNNTELVETVIKSKPFILCVSTIYKHKNYEVLIEAYSELPDSLRNMYSLVIAGGYSRQNYYDSIVRLTETNGINNNVVFLGKVDYESIPFLYSNAIVSVLPSKLETFGHPLVESMAAGTPLVAANSACIPEITDGAALLFDPDDSSDLSKCLQDMLTSPERRKSLTDAGNERIKDFSWDKTVQDTYAVLKLATNE